MKRTLSECWEDLVIGLSCKVVMWAKKSAHVSAKDYFEFKNGIEQLKQDIVDKRRTKGFSRR